ncbi:amidohydrolase [Peribacillus butanolivorans]|uniref:amidohydrolase n=1 Tax=Peribacillus butanolivorans TaxID=421767 RepID=UPI003670F69D
MNTDKNSDIIYVNGKIFTSNLEQPYASAMVVRDGRIEWVGAHSETEGMNGECVDLQGRRVLPGFIDAHLHPLFLAKASKQIPCMPPVVESIEDLIKEVRKQRESQNSEDWIESWGYDEGKLTEGRSPSRWDLDKATNDAPVIITRTCGHIVVVNSKALELAGITRDTPDPDGGLIDRDSEGEPTGVLRENAKELVNKVMPVQTFDEETDALVELSPKLLSHGITAITELLARTKPRDYLEMYNAAHEKGLKQRTVLYYIWEDMKNDPILDKDKTNRKLQNHIGGVKLFSDGSVSGQTAWINPPFLGEGENYGIQMTSKEELISAAEAAEKNNIQLVIHAMGEQAIDLIVNTFYGKKGWITDGPSIRIEHAAMPTKQALQRAAEAGIAFVPQPIFLYAEIESYLNNLGAERTKQTYPIQSMLKAGIKIAFSSDAPATAWVDPVNPFVGIKAAVTRIAYDGTDTGQDQRVDVPTAITLYTRAAQEITRIPNVGQLTPGYHADFIVLDQDILNISPEEIDRIQVEETYMGGQLVFQKETAITK